MAGLDDFEPLNPAEQRLIAGIGSVETVVFGQGVPPEDAGPERRIRAGLIAWLMRGGDGRGDGAGYGRSGRGRADHRAVEPGRRALSAQPGPCLLPHRGRAVADGCRDRQSVPERLRICPGWKRTGCRRAAAFFCAVPRSPGRCGCWGRSWAAIWIANGATLTAGKDRPRCRRRARARGNVRLDGAKGHRARCGCRGAAKRRSGLRGRDADGGEDGRRAERGWRPDRRCAVPSA
jgi:hypothetical protein